MEFFLGVAMVLKALAFIILGVGLALLALGLIERLDKRRRARLKFINAEGIKQYAAEPARKV